MKTLCLGCMREYEGDYDICPYCGYRQSSEAKEAYHISPGTMLHNRYIIGRVLGFGGFGITYIGFDTKLLHRVAIKEYFPSEFATRMPHQTEVHVFSGEKKEQFLAGMKKSLDEAKNLAEFRQAPGITQIYDFFEVNSTAYIVMELLEGETLKERLKREKKMPVEEALPIILSVTAALKEVHEKGIIHRDISPDNIYLLKSGEVKLLDFGAARQVTTTHSKSLTVILKLGYAPVEQYQSGGNQGPWTDVYSLAATFYKMITGVRPPESPERRAKDTLKEPSKLGVKIPVYIENALMNALQVRIEDRTQSAAEFEQALTSQSTVRTKATKEKEDIGKWPRGLKILCGAGAGVIILLSLLLATGVITPSMPKLPSFQKNEGMVWMPSLVNMSQSAAKKRLEELGLEYGLAGTQASDTIMKGYVLGQQDEKGNAIQPGDEVEIGFKINVILSTGNGKTVIPDIVWMSEEKGGEILSADGIVSVKVQEDSSGSWGEKGLITRIDPAPGTEIAYEDEVTVYVLKKTPELEKKESAVPEIVNLDMDSAREKLQQSGYFIEKTGLEYSADVPQGAIISQSPSSGEKGETGNVIKVVVSRGPHREKMVNVVNQSEEEAVRNLEELGFVVEHELIYTSDDQKNLVVSQSVEPGQELEEGARIVLTVSMGAEPVREQKPVNQPTQKKSNTQTQQPAQPAQSAQPAAPAQSAQPAAPAQSAQPAAPAQSAQPAAPAQSAQPALDPAFERLE